MTIVIQTLSEQIFKLVRDRVISGKLPTDSVIRQDALAAELGVSKIPLREALARLEQEGLLFSKTNRGFFVKPLSEEEAEEVYALRLKIEPDAVAEASLLATSKDIEIAKLALAALEKAASTDTKEDVGIKNRFFHMALVKPLNRDLTINFIERLNILAERYVGRHLEPAGRNDRAHNEHNLLFSLWKDRKTDELTSLMKTHISETLDDLRIQFKSDKANNSINIK